MDLVSRVLAAIAAKEEKARKAIEAKNEWCHVSSQAAGAKWRAVDGLVISEHEESLWDCEGSNTLCMAPEVAEFIAHNDPAAVLRRCAADREIVQPHRQEGTDRRWECELCGPEGQNIDCTYPCDTLRLLARGYGISVEEETTGE